MKYNKVALVGMPGSGKTKTAKIISEKLGINFFDTDKIFEEKFYSISEFFKIEGEKKFREEESLILKDTVNKSDFILSTGGGIILKPENREILFNSAVTTFYLKTSIEELLRRLSKDNTRPLLENKLDKTKSLIKLSEEREKYYLQAKHIVITDNKSTNTVANEIIEMIK